MTQAFFGTTDSRTGSSSTDSTYAGDERLPDEMLEIMNALAALIEQETALVAAGKLREAIALGLAKAELAGRYQAGTVRLRAGARTLRVAEPAICAELRERHERFRALLQLNQTVLATAHAVAEGLIRGAANECARKATPQGYGATGQAASPPRRSAQPVALSRSY
jgi:hypothetical protein